MRTGTAIGQIGEERQHYGLMWQPPAHLATQYFATITTKGDFSLYTSVLATIAPTIGNVGLSTIGRMLVAPSTAGKYSGGFHRKGGVKFTFHHAVR